MYFGMFEHTKQCATFHVPNYIFKSSTRACKHATKEITNSFYSDLYIYTYIWRSLTQKGKSEIPQTKSQLSFLTNSKHMINQRHLYILLRSMQNSNENDWQIIQPDQNEQPPEKLLLLP